MSTDVSSPDSPLQELVVVSGKGGTGKTSLTASFASLARNAVIADCDVDASDLHLILGPYTLERHEFISGFEAVIRPGDCTGCGVCRELCRFDAITSGGGSTGNPVYHIDPLACEGCGVCVRFCPDHAIDLQERACGHWMISDTRFGPMVHARLGVAAENSDKLVALVRKEAQRLAREQGRKLIVVDGPPGIGSPAIASLSGASLALVVTEPTVSGEHDLDRVLALARYFAVPAAVCVNKWDLNPEMTRKIEDRSHASGARMAGRIRYDRNVTLAQIQECTVVDLDTEAAGDIREIWKNLFYKE